MVIPLTLVFLCSDAESPDSVFFHDMITILFKSFKVNGPMYLISAATSWLFLSVLVLRPCRLLLTGQHLNAI